MADGTFLIRSRNKTGFLGIISNLNNLKFLYHRFLKTNLLKYIPMYKFNQDHLELFFGSVRCGLGHNNNPSIKQFHTVYKKLLIRCQIRERGIGNCLPLENLQILQIPSTPGYSVQQINESTRSAGLTRDNSEDTVPFLNFWEENEVLNEHDYIFNPTRLTEFSIHVVKYIAGFVVFKLNQKLKCIECVQALEGAYCASLLTAYKSRGYLKFASDSVIKICLAAEQELRALQHNLSSKTILKDKYFEKIALMTKTKLIGVNLFDNDNHFLFNNHFYLLINSIIEIYLHTRFFYIAKKSTEKLSLRNQLNRTIIFNHM